MLNLKYAPRDAGWPLCARGKIITHLCQPSKEFLQEGDSYLCLKLESPCKVVLTAQTLHNGELEETDIPRAAYKDVFTMEWLESRPHVGSNCLLEEGATVEDVKDILRNIIVGGELGLQRNTWEEFAKPTLTDRKTSRRFKLRRSKRNFRSSRPNFEEFAGSGRDLSVDPIAEDGSERDKSADTSTYLSEPQPCVAPSGSQCNTSNSATTQDIMDRLASRMPLTAMEVDFELLHSGAMIMPGSRDGRDAPILEICGDSTVWIEPQYSLQDLSNVLGYLHAIPREEVRNRGLSVAVDAREAPKSAVEIITEALQILEESRPGAISHVYILIKKDSVFTRLANSPIFKPKCSYKLEFVRTQDKLHQLLPSSDLTETFGGSFLYDHDAWIRFRMRLEPFMSGCRSAARYLLTSLEEFTGGSTMEASLSGMQAEPQGVEDIGNTMDEVQKKHRDIYQDRRLSGLHSEGNKVLQSLTDDQGPHAHTEDFKDAIACVSALFNQVHSACTRLDAMAEKRIEQLNQKLQIAAFEEESTKVTKWLSHEGEPHLQEMQEKTADSLNGIITIQKDFEKFYFKAMKYVGRGEDLLEDAHILSESSDDEQGTAIKELARDLRHMLSLFTDSLEDKRSYIEDAVRLYTMLDAAYEWALNGMKFAALLGPEEHGSRERCRLQLCKLEKYQRENPELAEDHFTKMQELATNLNQGKCMQQSDFAQKRCQETQNLLQKKIDQLKTMLVGRRPGGAGRSEPRSRSSRKSIGDIDRTRLVRFDKDSETGDSSTPASSVKPDLFRRVHSNSDPKQHRDSLYSNGSVDSGISVGDKTPTSPDGSTEPLAARQRRPVATIRPISEIINNERRTTSLERLDEGYEENEQNTTEVDLKKGQYSPVQRRNKNSRRRTEGGAHLTSRTDVHPVEKTELDEEYRLSDEEGDGQVETRWSPLDANRHIRRSMCLEPGQPIKIPINVEAQSHPGYRKMILLMDEMIATEQDYVHALKYIIDNYYPEMDREDIPQGLRGQRSAVFGNLEKIYEFHDRYFLQELKRCQSAPLQVCHSFLKHKKDFGLYALYNKNKPRSDSLLADYGSFFRGKQKILCDNMDVASYLLKPVQRLGKYALLIRDLIRECRPTDPELALLKASEEMVQFQMRHGNDLLAMDSLKDCDVNLFEQGDLLRQDEFLVYRGHRKCLRHVFLFQDLIIFSKTRRTPRGHDIYQYKFSLKMTDIGMTENKGESGLKFEIWFRRRKQANDKAYTLHCKNSQIKKEWTAHISKLLWQQAYRSKEARQAEMSNMGIGSKPCIDIKPSTNRINDRAIKFVGNRAPRDRNSIAVSSITAEQLVRSSYATSPRQTRPNSASLTQRALLGSLNFSNSNNLMEVKEELTGKTQVEAAKRQDSQASSSSGESPLSERRGPVDGELNSSDDDEKPISDEEKRKSNQFVTAVSSV